jgi:hypothetical protein
MEGRDKSRTRGAIAPVLPSTTTHGRDVLSALAAAWFSSHGTPGAAPQATPRALKVSPATLAAAGPNVPNLPRATARAAASTPPATRRARAR